MPTTTNYISILVDTGPIPVGLDSAKRSQYSINTTIQAIPIVDDVEKDFEQLLDDLSFLTVGDAFIGQAHSSIPTGPGPFFEIISIGGPADQLVHGQVENNIAWENLAVQIFLRGKDDRVTIDLARDVKNKLHGLFSREIVRP